MRHSIFTDRKVIIKIESDQTSTIYGIILDPFVRKSQSDLANLLGPVPRIFKLVYIPNFHFCLHLFPLFQNFSFCVYPLAFR